MLTSRKEFGQEPHRTFFSHPYIKNEHFVVLIKNEGI